MMNSAERRAIRAEMARELAARAEDHMNAACKNSKVQEAATWSTMMLECEEVAAEEEKPHDCANALAREETDRTRREIEGTPRITSEPSAGDD